MKIYIPLIFQWVIISLIFVVIVIISLLSWKSGKDKKEKNKKEKGKKENQTKLFSKLLRLTIIVIFIQIFFNALITTAQNKNIIVESALNYDDVLVILPSYLSLVVTIAMAIIQNKIQSELQIRNKNREDEEKEQNKKLREIDKVAHYSELISNSLKNSFNFNKNLRIKCLPDDNSSWVCLVVQCSDIANVYYNFTLNKVEIYISDHHISTCDTKCEKKQNYLFIKFHLNDLELLTIRNSIVNFLIGKYETMKCNFFISLKDDSLNFYYDEDKLIDVCIDSIIHPSNQISEQDELCMQADWHIRILKEIN